MTYQDAVELVQKWPADRSVPRKLKEAIATAKGKDKAFMPQLVEALMVSSSSKADFELIDLYFG